MLYCSIDKFLKEVRKFKKMTLQEVVDSCHTGKGALSEFENGKRNPSNNTIRRLLNYYNVQYVLNPDIDIYFFLDKLKTEELNYYINNYFFIISTNEKKVFLLERLGHNENGVNDSGSLDYHLREFNKTSLDIFLTRMYVIQSSNQKLEEEKKESIANLNGDQIKQLENIKVEAIKIMIKRLNINGLNKVIDYIDDLSINPKYQK